MVAVGLVCTSLTAAEPIRRPEYLIDSYGRIVIYHGLNVSNTAKNAEDFLPWQNPKSFVRMREWGFNLVRYLVFWEAIEPRRGHYDPGYIAATIERLGWCNEQGIDVLIDVHQDLYARKFTGNGFPEWTINDGGHPFKARQPWNMNYLSPAVQACYDNFWKDDRLRARYIAMLKYLLSMVERLPNVMGVDVMNEPFPGSDKQFEAGALTTFYNDILAMRKEAGFKTRLFFEPMMFTSAGLPTQLQVRWEEGTGYAPHFYDPLCHEGRPYDKTNQAMMVTSVRGKVAEAIRFETPMLYGEFGISTSVKNYQKYLKDFLRLLNQYHVSWAYYSYDAVQDGGFGILNSRGRGDVKLPLLITVYAQRIAGRNPVTEWEDNAFTLSYDPIRCDAPTVVFVPLGLTDVRVTINDKPVRRDRSSCYIHHRHGQADARQTIRVEWQ